MIKKIVIFVLFLNIAGYSQELNWGNIQWASSVESCSHEYKVEINSPLKALGAPDSFLQRPDALKNSFLIGWNNKANIENSNAFVKVKFGIPQKINKVVIAENYTPGSITEVYIYDEGGKEKLVYKNKAMTLPDTKRLLQINFDLTTYNVAAVKIVADPTVNKAWNGIDAIGIGEVYGEVKTPRYIENLGYEVNSEYSDLGPKISADGKTLYFVRSADPANKGIKVQPNDQDVWVSDQDEKGNWKKAVNIGAPINNDQYNWPVSVSPDEQTMVVSGRYDQDGKYIGRGLSYFSKTKKGVWSNPKEMVIKNFSTKTPTLDYFLSENKKHVLLCINPIGLDHDLYVSHLEKDGTYTEPKSLGSVLNTKGIELGAFLASDNVTLYFSSDGHGGYGSSDIFMTKRLDETWENWSTPVNLGETVNSKRYESDFSISAKGDYAYFVTYTDSYGKADIVRVILEQEMRPNPVVLIKGRVINKATNQPIKADIVYESLLDSNIEGTATSEVSTGFYKAVLPYGKNYGVIAGAEGFYPVSQNLDLTQVSDYKEIEKDLYLVPLEKGTTYRLNNLFFDTGKYELLATSNSELDRLANIMIKEPLIKIVVSGHTDDVGSDASNIILSKNRAQSVINYLLSKSIDKTRLKFEGLGESQPEASNDTEEGRQLNRRVSFTILEK